MQNKVNALLKPTYLKCVFPTSQKLYSYRTLLTPAPQPDELLLVHTPSGYGIVKVVESESLVPDRATEGVQKLGYKGLAWAFQRVDTNKYEDLIKTEEKIIQALNNNQIKKDQAETLSELKSELPAGDYDNIVTIAKSLL